MKVVSVVSTGMVALGILALEAGPAQGYGFSFNTEGALAKNPLVRKWYNLDNQGRIAGFKDPNVDKNYRRRCGGRNFFACELAHELFMGNTPPNFEAIKQYTLDTFAIFQVPDGRRGWAPILSVRDEGIVGRAPLSAVFFKTPNAGAALGKWIDSPEKERLLCSGDAAKANGPVIMMQSLFYLGAKDQVDTMIAAFDMNCNQHYQVRAAANFLDEWTLTQAQQKKAEDFCVKAFQAGRHNARFACIRYLGRVKTKNQVGQQFITRSLGAEGAEQLEAIRAVSHLELKAAKGQLLQTVKRAESKRSVFERRGRKQVRKEITGWRTNQGVVQSAVALAAMGDSYARKAVSFWLTVPPDAKHMDLNALAGVFREAAFATPRGRKALKGELQKTYKAIERSYAKSADRNLERYVGYAATSLVQMGDSTGMKGVLKVLNGSDNGTIKSTLDAFGGAPHHVLGIDGTPTGIGHILVGKNGLSVKDAATIAATIKKQFTMWGDKKLREAALHAYYDILARIDIVTKRL